MLLVETEHCMKQISGATQDGIDEETAREARTIFLTLMLVFYI
jgi:hypothetical protein